MEDTNFKELFQKIVDRYELAPEVVAEDEDWDLFVLADEDDDADEFPPL